MIINILTLFPEMFSSILSTSIIRKAIIKDKIDIRIINFRDFSFVKSRQVDAYPYGGGAGMVLKPEPIGRALDFLEVEDSPIIYFTPQGRVLNQSIIHQYDDEKEITIVCGHYKEMDQRIRDLYVTDEISVGDYVLSGGELPSMIFIDALARLQEDVISDMESALTDSHQQGLLGCPHYTRPAIYKDLKVPEVLKCGDPKKIDKWRQEKSFEITKKIRPDLLDE